MDKWRYWEAFVETRIVSIGFFIERNVEMRECVSECSRVPVFSYITIIFVFLKKNVCVDSFTGHFICSFVHLLQLDRWNKLEGERVSFSHRAGRK